MTGQQLFRSNVATSSIIAVLLCLIDTTSSVRSGLLCSSHMTKPNVSYKKKLNDRVFVIVMSSI